MYSMSGHCRIENGWLNLHQILLRVTPGHVLGTKIFPPNTLSSAPPQRKCGDYLCDFHLHTENSANGLTTDPLPEGWVIEDEETPLNRWDIEGGETALEGGGIDCRNDAGGRGY